MQIRNQINKSVLLAILFTASHTYATSVHLNAFAQYGFTNLKTLYDVRSPINFGGDLSVGDLSVKPTHAFGGSAGVFWDGYDFDWGRLVAGPSMSVMGAHIKCHSPNCEARNTRHSNVYFGIGYLSIPLSDSFALYAHPGIGYASGTIKGRHGLDGQIEFDGISYGLRTGVAYTVNERFKINAGLAFWLLDVHAPPEDPDVGEFESPTTANVEQPFHIHEFLLELGVTAMFPQ